MMRNANHRTIPSALALVLLSAVPASAAESVSSPQDAVNACSALHIEVERWAPPHGPPARFVAESFARGGADRWTGLGYTDDGFWSAESRTPSDACDDCQELDLVLTHFDGTRRAFPVVTMSDRQRVASSASGSVRDVALGRLWHLAATDWPVKDLRQDYALRLPPTRDADGLADPYPGWMTEVSKKDTWLLRFAERAEQNMCWCFFHWSGWTLTAPRKP
jgi:hypothetical protein